MRINRDELDKKLSQIMSGDYICGITDIDFFLNEILNDETITDRFREEVINAVRNNPFLKILFKIYNKTKQQ